MRGLESRRRELRERIPLRIAIDETAAMPGALTARVADAVCLKISRCGGIGALLAAAALVRSSGAEVYLGVHLRRTEGHRRRVARERPAPRSPPPPCGLATLELFEAATAAAPCRTWRDRSCRAEPGLDLCKRLVLASHRARDLAGASSARRWPAPGDDRQRARRRALPRDSRRPAVRRPRRARRRGSRRAASARRADPTSASSPRVRARAACGERAGVQAALVGGDLLVRPGRGRREQRDRAPARHEPLDRLAPRSPPRAGRLRLGALTRARSSMPALAGDEDEPRDSRPERQRGMEREPPAHRVADRGSQLLAAHALGRAPSPRRASADRRRAGRRGVAYGRWGPATLIPVARGAREAVEQDGHGGQSRRPPVRFGRERARRSRRPPPDRRVRRRAARLGRDRCLHLPRLALDAAGPRPRPRAAAPRPLPHRRAHQRLLRPRDGEAHRSPRRGHLHLGNRGGQPPPGGDRGERGARTLIVLTADRPPELREIGAGQTIDQVKLYGDAVRWFFEVGTHDGTPARTAWIRALACRAWPRRPASGRGPCT